MLLLPGVVGAAAGKLPESILRFVYYEARTVCMHLCANQDTCMAGPGCSSGWGLLQKLTHKVTVTAAAWSAMLQFLQVVCLRGGSGWFSRVW